MRGGVGHPERDERARSVYTPSLGLPAEIWASVLGYEGFLQEPHTMPSPPPSPPPETPPMSEADRLRTELDQIRAELGSNEAEEGGLEALGFSLLGSASGG